MYVIFQVETDEHRQHVRALYKEYLEYVNQKVGEYFGFSFEVDPAVERDMNDLYRLSPPQGRMFLVQVDDQIAGLGGLRQIGESTAEVKRMFVRPGYQGNGVGRALLQTIVEAAHEIGYSTVRLDVGPYAGFAEKLYRSAGFADIAPYPESEVPPALRSNWQFLELTLN